MNDNNSTSAIPPKFGYDPKYWSDYLDITTDTQKENNNDCHKQLDTLLVFSGLFMGANTGFLAISQGLLSPSASDQNNALLRLFLTHSNVNSTLIEEASQPWKLEASGVRINCWFAVSLCLCTLTAVEALANKLNLQNASPKIATLGTLEKRVAIMQGRMFDTETLLSMSRGAICMQTFGLYVGGIFFLIGCIDYFYHIHQLVGLITLIPIFITYGYVGAGGIVGWVFCMARLDPDWLLQQIHHYVPNSANFMDGIHDALANLVSIDEEIDMMGNWYLEDLDQRSQNHATISIRWILSNAHSQQALVQAAKNIPALQDAMFTRRIFTTFPALAYHQMPDGTFQSPLTLKKSSVYQRLVSIFRGSLAQYAIECDSTQQVSKEVADEVVIYGRAVCHSLISCPDPAEGFLDLSDLLGEFSSLVRSDLVSGELKLLLTCSLNRPALWGHPQELDAAFEKLDPSTHPLYVSIISIASASDSVPNRSLWVTRVAHRSLRPDHPSPRTIGLVAKSLVYTDAVGYTDLPTDFCDAYSSDANYVSDVLEALQAYPTNVERCLEVYPALIRAFRSSIEELHCTPDDFHAKDDRPRRQEHRDELGRLGSDLLKVLEDILDDVSSRIQAISIHQHKTEVPTPNQPETTPRLSNRSTLLLLQCNILDILADGVLEGRWGSGLKLTEITLWRTAAVLEPDNNAFKGLLDLMRKVGGDQSRYIDWFQQYPSVATCITLALSSDIPSIRKSALLLVRDKAEAWFRGVIVDRYTVEVDPAISSAFQGFLDTAVGSQEVPLVSPSQAMLEWRKKLLDALYNAALSTMSTSPDYMEALQLSLDGWSALKIVDSTPESAQNGLADRNWYSEEMLSVFTRYIRRHIEVYNQSDEDQKAQLAEVGIATSLQNYCRDFHRFKNLHQGMAETQLLQTFEEWRILLHGDERSVAVEKW